MSESTARAIAHDVAAGTLRAVEVTAAALERITAQEEEIHAFNTVMADEALGDAEAVDAAVAAGNPAGALAGVPIAVKDNLCTRGIPTTCSSAILDGWLPPYNATVISKLREAGAIIVGKTNLDEFAMGSSTEHSAFGPTKNPRDLSRVPGGSSGGSAASVAAGFTPISLGSDTGGSIRQPAAFCGVVGVKPTYGRVSRYGLVAFASSLDQIGPFAGTVGDAALLLETISGHDPYDSTSIDAPPVALMEVLDRGMSGLRIGVLEEFTTGLDPAVQERVEHAIDACAAAGASIQRISIPSVAHALAAYYLIAPAEASSNLARYDGVRYGLRTDAEDVTQMNGRTRSAGFGEEVKRRIMLGTYALSAGYYDAYYRRAQQVRTVIIQEFARAYSTCDVLIGATTPTVAFPFGAKTDDPYSMYLSDVCTIPSNLAGHPAMSLPFGTGDDGLPVGVQLLAPAMGEPVMFQVAAELERAMS